MPRTTLSPARWNKTAKQTEEGAVPLMHHPQDTPPTPEPDDVLDPPVPEGTIEDLTSPAMVEKALRAGKAAAAIMHGEEPPSTLPTLPNAAVPLLQAFSQHLTHKVEAWYQDYHKHSMTSVEETLRYLRTWMEAVSHHSEHAQYQMSNALEAVATGGIGTPPYQVTLHVKTPDGYGMDLVITKQTSEALIEELGRLEPWLRTSGYQAA